MEALWDAVKKSLDVAPTPVNLKLIQGIKALSRRSFGLLKDPERDIIGGIYWDFGLGAKNSRNFLMISSNKEVGSKFLQDRAL